MMSSIPYKSVVTSVCVSHIGLTMSEIKTKCHLVSDPNLGSTMLFFGLCFIYRKITVPKITDLNSQAWPKQQPRSVMKGRYLFCFLRRFPPFREYVFLWQSH